MISHIRDADSILIFGPGEAKGELKKRLESKGLGGRVDQDELVRIATEGIEISTELVALLHHATLLRLITESSLQVPGGDDA